MVADAVSSRSPLDRRLALDRASQIGCFITTAETVALGLVGDKDHPRFKEVQAVIKKPAAETQLTAAPSNMEKKSVKKASERKNSGLVLIW